MKEADLTREETGAAPAEPGDVSRLLEELARTPERELREAWERGLQPGAIVGRFELLRELGRGGFGVVYEARDRELGRLVAFKAIRPGNRSLAELRQHWLQREAEAAAQLNHPNIVTLHDFGRAESGPYLILELLHGKTLQQRMEAGPLPVGEAVRIAIAVARAVAHAHACGVVHRDLKPSNVFLCDDGTVKVLDFGLAGILTAGASSGGGTPAFMAPEQWRREGEDERTDLFALGVIVHAMISGTLPFRASSGTSAVLESGAAPLLTGAPAALSSLVARLLEKDRERRPSSATAVLESLEGIARGLERDRPRRRPWRWAVLAAVLLAIVSGLFVWRTSRAPVAAGERVVVAVADFVNETGEADLDGLSGMLITSLEESRLLTVLTRSRMLDVARQLGRKTDARVDEGLGRAVASNVRARALLLTTIRRFDSVYAIDLQALDPQRNEFLFTVSEQGRGRQSIPSLIDRLSERTRRELHERAADVDTKRVRLAEAVTGDMEAYRHFFQGQQCIEGLSHVQDCAADFRRAVEIDPDFALAHWMLAYTGEFRGAPIEEQRAAIGEAMRRVDRVPWKDGQLIRAWAAHLDGDQTAALALYDAVIEAFPQDRQAQYLAGDLLFHEGLAPRAIPYFERALELGHPAMGVIRSHLVDSLALAGRAGDALLRARDWAKSGDLGDARVLAKAEAWAGKPADAVRTLRAAAARSVDPEIRMELAHALLGVAEYREAEQIFAVIAGESSAKPLVAQALGGLAIVRAYTGQQREAWRLLERARETGKHMSADAYDGAVWHALERDRDAVWREAQRAMSAEGRSKLGGRYAVLLAYTGDLERAAELEHHIAAGTPQAEAYRAILAWRRGDGEEALAIARASPAPPIPMVYTAGQIALESGDPTLAVEWLERLRVMTMGDGGGLWRAWSYPRSLYLSAVAHEQTGRPERALARLDELLSAWRPADPDAPLLAEARALRAKLERGVQPVRN
jgi:tetratricopeptide (TPR) repeat protein